MKSHLKNIGISTVALSLISSGVWAMGNSNAVDPQPRTESEREVSKSLDSTGSIADTRETRRDKGVVPSRAPEPTRSQTAAGDSMLAQEINNTLRADRDLRTQLARLQVEARDGEVTLSGYVDNEDTKQKIADKVQNLQGVRKINNQIRVNR